MHICTYIHTCTFLTQRRTILVESESVGMPIYDLFWHKCIGTYKPIIRIFKIIDDEYLPVISETYTLTCIALVVSTWHRRLCGVRIDNFPKSKAEVGYPTYTHYVNWRVKKYGINNQCMRVYVKKNLIVLVYKWMCAHKYIYLCMYVHMPKI